mmetsp:Transcript_18487/g.33489  ORF Transcript_18487/g.33489 Transcript_18487/m.33489 type:complete len:80 (-) Transcript_18487:2397-2636(-)
MAKSERYPDYPNLIDPWQQEMIDTKASEVFQFPVKLSLFSDSLSCIQISLSDVASCLKLVASMEVPSSLEENSFFFSMD